MRRLLASLVQAAGMRGPGTRSGISTLVQLVVEPERPSLLWAYKVTVAPVVWTRKESLVA
jgi:hypothetical protein